MPNSNIPAPRVPLVDQKSGLISREWYRFLLVLFNRVGGGEGVDGDKGDIVVSNDGNTFTIDSGVVSTAKMGGDVTTAGKALLDDLTPALQRQTLGIDASTVPYSPSTISHWDGNVDPGDVDDALDQIARRTNTLESGATLSYDPAEPGNWLADPTTVSVALDELATRASLIIDKTSNETRNSTTNLEEDAELVLPVKAGKSYRAHGVVFMRTANATMDLKYSLQCQNGFTDVGTIFQRHVPAGGTTETLIGT